MMVRVKENIPSLIVVYNQSVCLDAVLVVAVLCVDCCGCVDCCWCVYVVCVHALFCV